MTRKFGQYCTPRLQHNGETIEQYFTDLKHKAKTCNYGILEEFLIRDQIVLGTLNLKVKEKLLSHDELDLEKAVPICQTSEVAKHQVRAMTDGATSSTVRTKVTRRISPDRSQRSGRTTQANRNVVAAGENTAIMNVRYQ